MTFVRDNGPASAEALAEFESKLGGLPTDYRDFIAAHNGVGLSATAQMRGPEKWGVATIEGIQDTEFWSEDYPVGSMPIATDGTGNTYIMALTGESRGRIHFLDHERPTESEMPVGQLPVIAASFGDFLPRIDDFDSEDPESEQLFRTLAERDRKLDDERKAIYETKKPWWKLW